MAKKRTSLIAVSFVSLCLASTLMYRQHLNKTHSALVQHCININNDTTRPDTHYCDDALSLDNNVLRFIDRKGKIEQYEVVSTKADVYDLQDNTFYYNFIAYEEK